MLFWSMGQLSNKALDFIDQPNSSPTSPADTWGVQSNAPHNVDKCQEITKAVFHTRSNCAMDMILAKRQGLDIDNDNKQVPENIPAQWKIPHTTNLYPGQM